MWEDQLIKVSMLIEHCSSPSPSQIIAEHTISRIVSYYPQVVDHLLSSLRTAPLDHSFPLVSKIITRGVEERGGGEGGREMERRGERFVEMVVERFLGAGGVSEPLIEAMCHMFCKMKYTTQTLSKKIMKKVYHFCQIFAEDRKIGGTLLHLLTSICRGAPAEYKQLISSLDSLHSLDPSPSPFCAPLSSSLSSSFSSSLAESSLSSSVHDTVLPNPSPDLPSFPSFSLCSLIHAAIISASASEEHAFILLDSGILETMATFLSNLLYIPEDRGTRLPLPILEGKRALSLLMIIRSAVLQESLTVFVQQEILPILLSFFHCLKEVGWKKGKGSREGEEEGWWEELLVVGLDVMLLCSNIEEGQRREVGEMVCELGREKFGWLARMGGEGLGGEEEEERENVFLVLVRLLLKRGWNRVLFCLPEEPSSSSSSSSFLSSLSSSSSPFPSSSPLSIPYASWSRSPFTPLVECSVSSEMVDFLKKFEAITPLTFPTKKCVGMPIFDIVKKGKNNFSIVFEGEEEKGRSEEGERGEEGDLRSVGFWGEEGEGKGKKGRGGEEFVEKNGESLCEMVISSDVFVGVLREEGRGKEIGWGKEGGEGVVKSQSIFLNLLSSILPLPSAASTLLSSPSSHALLLFSLGASLPSPLPALRHHLPSPSAHHALFSSLSQPLLSQLTLLFPPPPPPMTAFDPMGGGGGGGSKEIEWVEWVERVVESGLVEGLVRVLKHERELREACSSSLSSSCSVSPSSPPVFSQAFSLLSSLLAVLGGKKLWEEDNILPDGERKWKRKGGGGKGEKREKLAKKFIQPMEALVEIFKQDMLPFLSYSHSSSSSSSSSPFYSPTPYYTSLFYCLTYLFSTPELFHLLPSFPSPSPSPSPCPLAPLQALLTPSPLSSLPSHLKWGVFEGNLRQFLDNIDFFDMKLNALSDFQ